MEKQAFVTGGSGHVGANLIRILVYNGWKVRCLVHHDGRAFEGLNIELIKGSILDSSFLKQQMKGCYAVFHAAAIVGVENINVDEMKRVNIEGTRAMCNAALSSEIKRFIYFSSIHAFQQEPLDRKLTEERLLVTDPKSSQYDLTKAHAEKEVKKAHKAGLSTIVLNPTGILGPYDFKPSRMGQLLKNIMNQKMLLTINTGFNWVDVRDVCSAAIESVEKATPGENYILSGKWATFHEIADMVSIKINKTTRWATLPFWSAYLFLPFAHLFSKILLRRPLFSKGSLHTLAVQATPTNKKAKECFAFTPRPLSETINDTIDWITKNNV